MSLERVVRSAIRTLIVGVTPCEVLKVSITGHTQDLMPEHIAPLGVETTRPLIEVIIAFIFYNERRDQMRPGAGIQRAVQVQAGLGQYVQAIMQQRIGDFLAGALAMGEECNKTIVLLCRRFHLAEVGIVGLSC